MKKFLLSILACLLCALPSIAGNITVYWDDSHTNWGTVKVHYWGGSSSTNWNENCPVMQDTDHENIYSIEIPDNSTILIFRNNNGNEQTIDIVNEDIKAGAVYKGTGSNKFGFEILGQYSDLYPTSSGETGGGETGGGGQEPTDEYSSYPVMYLIGANYGGWNVNDNFICTRQENTANYSITVPRLSGEFKIGSQGWVVDLGAQGDVTITESCTQPVATGGANFKCDGLDNVTISFTLTKNGDSYSCSTITFTVQGSGSGSGGETGGGGPEPTDEYSSYPDMYLIGANYGGWNTDDNFICTRQENTANYSITVPRLSGEFKIASKNWVVDLGATESVTITESCTQPVATGGANFNCNGLNDVTISFQLTKNGDNYTCSSLIFNVQGGSTVIPNDRCDNILPGALASGTLPILYINVYKENANGDKVYDDAVIDRDLRDKNYRKGEYWLDMNGCQWLIEAGGADLGSADEPLPLEIKARGNYTRTGFSKKPYKLKLGKKQSMLGMTPDKSKHWALMAHADDDMGYLRNFVGFNLAHRIGLYDNADSPAAWTPSQQPVEVVINGDYRGLYFLTESIRVGDGRVNIQELKDGETDRNLISGGYLVELDNYRESDETQIYINDDLKITFESPEVYSDIQRQFVTEQFNTMNSLVYAHSQDLWRYLDLDDAVRYYLTYEITSHWEAYHGSTYMFRDRGNGQKWHFSPVWDFGNAFNGSTNNYLYIGSTFGNTWIGDIRQNNKFNQRLGETWKWFMSNCYQGLEQDINEYVAHISQAAIADHNRWKDALLPPSYDDPTNDYWPTNPTPVQDNSDMDSKKNLVLTKLNQKISWLAQQWNFGNYNGTYTEPTRDNTEAAPLPGYADPNYVPTYIYVSNKADWDNIHAYLYNSGNDVYEAWPGKTLSEYIPDLAYTHEGQQHIGLWRMEIPYQYRGGMIIFSDGTNGTAPDKRYPADGTDGKQIQNGKNVFFITGTETLISNVEAESLYYYQPPFSGTLPVLYINTTDNAAVQYGTDVAGTFWVDPLESGAAAVGKRDEQLALSIKGRGSSSWGRYEKKSYKLSLDKKAAFGDMPKSKHWVLMSYVDDAANGLLTNYAGHEIARALEMKWTPGMEPVEVVLNGDYIGLYFIVENIRPDKNRVAVNDTDDKKTYDAENDWILEFDYYANEADAKYMWTANETTFKVVPSHPDITTDELQQNLNAAVNNLRSYMPTGQNDTDWKEYIDIDEASKFYIVQEVMDCKDAFSNSLFMYHTTGSKWFFGPVWDFGASMASEDGKNALIHNQENNPGVVFLNELYNNVYFRDNVIETFLSHLNKSEIATDPSNTPMHAPRVSNGTFDEVNAKITAMAEKITPAAAKDADRWPNYAATSDENTLEDRALMLTNGINANINYLAKSEKDGGAGWTSENIVTAVSFTTTDNNAKPEYYDLTGTRISQPVKGQLYIVRRGSKVTKLIF